MTEDYETELTTSREEAATVLHGLADGVAAGAVRLGSGDDERTVGVPEQVDLEVEFETEAGQVGLEVEVEWAEGAAEDAVDEAGDPSRETAGEPSAGEGEEPSGEEPTGDEESAGDPAAMDDLAGIAEPAVGAAAQRVSLGRFELFEDRGGEWRWRLVHRNGNVIATSGEGYTRKHNARKGLRSVMRNAEGAEVTERPDG